LLNREAQFVLDLIGQGIGVVLDFPLALTATVEAFDLTGTAHADTGTTAFGTVDDAGGHADLAPRSCDPKSQRY
jgi:hypothetical protein